MLSSSSSSPSSKAEQLSRSGINAVSSDILRSHILTRLDGASLSALSCTCSHLHSCSEESLWKEKSSATWPSTLDTRVQSIISMFPAGYRSFFSDSFLFLAHGGEIDLLPSVDTTELVSAVDIFYKDFLEGSSDGNNLRLVPLPAFSVRSGRTKKLISTRVSLIDQWEGDTWKNELEENLSLSRILIDPTHKRAADVSTRKLVSVHCHWLTGEVHVIFSTIFSVGEEQVEFTVTMKIREVSLMAEDMEGLNLGGRGALVILAAGGEEEGKEKYKEFVNTKTAKKEMKLRREKGTAMETAACLVAVVILGCLLCFYLFVHKNMVAIIKKLIK